MKRFDPVRWILAANALFWVVFAALFLVAARQDTSTLCIDHCHAAYAFWGVGLGYNANPFSHLFMRVMAYLQAPAFFVSRAAECSWTGQPLGTAFSLSYPNSAGGVLHFGVSNDAYQLLLTLALSFLQWWLISVGAMNVMRSSLRPVAKPGQAL